MKEYKFKFDNLKASKIVKTLTAHLKEVTAQEDLYLISDGNDIFRIVSKNEEMYLYHLTKNYNGFEVVMSKKLDDGAKSALQASFQDSAALIKKKRSIYLWHGSEICISNIDGLGEFVEIFPESEDAKRVIMNTFEVRDTDLLAKSYYDLKVERQLFKIE